MMLLDIIFELIECNRLFKFTNKVSCSGPTTSHLCKLLLFSVNPVAPPTPLPFSCSWLWSSPTFENFQLVFCTVNFAYIIADWTSLLNWAWFWCEWVVILRSCNGSEKSSRDIVRSINYVCLKISRADCFYKLKQNCMQ